MHCFFTWVWSLLLSVLKSYLSWEKWLSDNEVFDRWEILMLLSKESGWFVGIRSDGQIKHINWVGQGSCVVHPRTSTSKKSKTSSPPLKSQPGLYHSGDETHWNQFGLILIDLGFTASVQKVFAKHLVDLEMDGFALNLRNKEILHFFLRHCFSNNRCMA